MLARNLKEYLKVLKKAKPHLENGQTYSTHKITSCQAPKSVL